MGGSSSKAKVDPGLPAGGMGAAAATPIKGGQTPAEIKKAYIQEVADEKKLFDAHCHYTGYMQNTEGISALSQAMDKNAVGYAALCGTPFKKSWVGTVDENGRPNGAPPVHHLYDDGDLYYYSACDGSLYRSMMTAADKVDMSKYLMLACGLNLGDYSCGELAKDLNHT